MSQTRTEQSPTQKGAGSYGGRPSPLGTIRESGVYLPSLPSSVLFSLSNTLEEPELRRGRGEWAEMRVKEDWGVLEGALRARKRLNRPSAGGSGDPNSRLNTHTLQTPEKCAAENSPSALSSDAAGKGLLGSLLASLREEVWGVIHLDRHPGLTPSQM